MRLCHVSHSKAKRLLEDAKLDTSLFRYDSKKDILTAISILNFATDRKSRKGHDMLACYVIKINKKKDNGTNWALSALTKEFRKLLVLCNVNAKERDDSFTVGIPNNLVCKAGYSFTIAKGANIIGQSKTSFRRVRNELKKEERLQITTHRKVSSFKYIDEVPKPEPGVYIHIGDGIYFMCSADSYVISKRGDNERFKHVIFNHENRIHSKYMKPNMNDLVEEKAYQCCH
jgi:hypothetical protein